MNDDRMLQIGEVAEAVGLSLRTIRYYEETGLVPPSGRSSGGFRLYTERDVKRLLLVKQMKPLDLSLEEMGELFNVRDELVDPATPSARREELVDRLSMFAELADERCARLREQVAAGEQLSASLRAEAAAVNVEK